MWYLSQLGMTFPCEIQKNEFAISKKKTWIKWLFHFRHENSPDTNPTAKKK
jgi:hypothetical protein